MDFELQWSLENICIELQCFFSDTGFYKEHYRVTMIFELQGILYMNL